MKLIKRLIRRGLARWGWDLVRRDTLASEQYLSALIARLNVDLVLDVGANEGQTGREIRGQGYPGRIVSFEPQPEVFRQLQTSSAGDTLWECRQEGLGADDGVMNIQISGFSPSSSLLPMGRKHIEVWPASAPVGKVAVSVRRLDGLATELRLEDHRTLLKLDVQGYESAVLAGARTTLGRVVLAQVELLFAPLYEGQARYHEVMATLDAAGLRFAGLIGLAHDPVSGFPLYADGVFVRESE